MRKLHPFCIAIGMLALAATVPAFAQRARRGYSYESGQDLYQHICQGCHMPDGRGAVGAGMYPPLAGNARLQSPLYPALVILRGQKAMPAFSELTDSQVAAVTNYIRVSFGNAQQGSITPEQVTALRPQAVHQDAGQPG